MIVHYRQHEQPAEPKDKPERLSRYVVKGFVPDQGAVGVGTAVDHQQTESRQPRDGGKQGVIKLSYEAL